MSNSTAIELLMNEYLKEKEALEREVDERENILQKDLVKIQDLCHHEAFSSEYNFHPHRGKEWYTNKCNICGKVNYSGDEKRF